MLNFRKIHNHNYSNLDRLDLYIDFQNLEF